MGTAERGQSSGSSDARKKAQTNDRLEHQHKNSQIENSGMGWARPQRCAACASPGGKKHSVACLNQQEEWKTRTIPQSARVTRVAGTDLQQDTQGTRVKFHNSHTNDRNRRQYRETGCEETSETLTNLKLAKTNLRILESGHPRNEFDMTSKTSCAIEKDERDAYRS